MSEFFIYYVFHSFDGFRKLQRWSIFDPLHNDQM